MTTKTKLLCTEILTCTKPNPLHSPVSGSSGSWTSSTCPNGSKTWQNDLNNMNDQESTYSKHIKAREQYV